MIQIARTWRTFAGGLAAGAVGVVMFAGGTASAEPLVPQPAVPGVPMLPATAPGATVFPGGANTNRFAPAPAQAPVPLQAVAPAQLPAPVAAPSPATVPAAVPAPAASAPQPPAVTPATTGTLREHLESKGVKLEAQRPLGFKALDITVPMPPRWTQVPDPNVPDAFVVIADRVGGNSVYTSNAQVVVYKLVGDFDPAEAITHGFVDSQRLLAWQTTNASFANLGAFPSSVIEGTYRENDMTLNTSRRHVFASSGSDKYLVSLSVTTAATQAVSDAPATDAIVNGFRVSTPGAAAQAPARVGAPTGPSAPAPAATPAPAPQAPASQAPAPQAPARTTPPQAPVAPAAPTAPAAPIPPPAPVQAIHPVPRAVPAQPPAVASNPAPASPPLVTLTPAPAR
ncbi:hypothetical protein A5634_04915 [Mycobacterium asiaticum]|uniref:Proline-rich 28 kDa antigen n=1 Tax=Mycobacterium asiaticum TaxID=1790 RepID=A0A1A3NRV5_MYCAS|nr:LpqN/LpqT family lipoprotein [Mycobacterium asiaticum]OBK23779.1 hypothetical protein A5634_04915 [Mycobacterium asiaticum]